MNDLRVFGVAPESALRTYFLAGANIFEKDIINPKQCCSTLLLFDLNSYTIACDHLDVYVC